MCFIYFRHRRNGCVIARSSQPKMGIFGWREPEDEKLIQDISDACLSDPGEDMKINGKEELYSLKSDVDNDLSIYCGEEKKLTSFYCHCTFNKCYVIYFSTVLFIYRTR